MVAMVFQWFPMVANHWSDDGMVTIHRSGLIPVDFKSYAVVFKGKGLMMVMGDDAKYF